MYIYGRRKKFLLASGVLFSISIVFFFLWFIQPMEEPDSNESGFQIIDDSNATPSVMETPEETPEPIAITPSPTPTPTPSPLDLKKELIKMCGKSLDAGQCLSRVALALGDPALCEETTLKESCYLNVAMELRDLNLCDKTDARVMCQAIALDKPELCETAMPGEGVEIDVKRAIEVCYLDTAIRLGKIELCEKTNIPWDCKYEVAVLTEDVEGCAEANNRRECEAVASSNTALCEEAFVPGLCYGLLAIKLNDVSLVEKTLMDIDYYYEIAKNSKDMLLCEKARDPVNCKAVLSRDQDLCKETNNRKACYGELAIALAEDEAAKQE